MITLPLCSKFFHSALANYCSFPLMRFLTWLQNMETFRKIPVLCEHFGDFMVDLIIRVGAICSSEFWTLFSQDCLSSFPTFYIFLCSAFERATNLLQHVIWHPMADSILTGILTSEHFKFWIYLAFKIL